MFSCELTQKNGRIGSAVLTRVPHFATKYRNIVSQITLILILFSMVSVFTGYFFKAYEVMW